MKIPVLVFQGLVSVLFVVVPVYAIAFGVILRCNATLRFHIMKAAATSAGNYAALLSSEILRLERLCTILGAHSLPDTVSAKRYTRLLSLPSMFQGLYVTTENEEVQGVLWDGGSLRYAKSVPNGTICLYTVNKTGTISGSPVHCMEIPAFPQNSTYQKQHRISDSSFIYLPCKGEIPLMCALDLERFSEERGRPLLLVDRRTGEEIFRSRPLPPSGHLLELAGEHVQWAWGNVSRQVCFWDGNTPVCLEPVDALGAVLVTREEVDMPRSVGATTVAAVAAAMAVPLALFWVFTMAVGQAIRRISKDMHAVSELDFDLGGTEIPATLDSSTTSNIRTPWWKRLVPRVLTKIHAGVRGLRMCAMALSSYVSPHLTREIIGSCHLNDGRSETRKVHAPTSSTPTPKGIAIMFVSLKDHGYLSAISNKGSWRVLSTFYRNFGEVICSCNGFIDKYINGSIMAIFDRTHGMDIM